MTVGDHSFVHENGGCTAEGDFIDRVAHIDKTGVRPHGDTVIQGDDDNSARVAVYNSFHTDLFSEHVCYKLALVTLQCFCSG